jgi:hypothetical protein
MGSHSRAHLLGNTEALSLLVASFLSLDRFIRIRALEGLLSLKSHLAEDSDDFRPPKPAFLNPPAHIVEATKDNSDLERLTAATVYFVIALDEVKRNKNLYSFCKAICPLIPESEYLIAPEHLNDPALPWRNSSEALTLCAAAIRNKHKGEELDVADVLQLKGLSIHGSFVEAHKLADRALRRNPRHAFFCYARSLNAQPDIGLDLAQKGLSIPGMPHGLWHSLLH